MLADTFYWQIGATIMNIATVGMDISKYSFHLHAVDAEGRLSCPQRLRRGENHFLLLIDFALPGRHGGLRLRTPLGTRDPAAWTRCEINAAGIYKALRAAGSQERRH